MCPCRTSPQATSTPVAASSAAISRLLARFSSAVPQVIVIRGAPGAAVVAACTERTKPVTSEKNSYADSCGSSSGVKNDPDWSSRPPNVPGDVHAACSAATPPRLCPVSTGRWSVGRTSSSRGSTCRVSAVAYAGLAE